MLVFNEESILLIVSFIKLLKIFGVHKLLMMLLGDSGGAAPDLSPSLNDLQTGFSFRLF